MKVKFFFGFAIAGLAIGPALLAYTFFGRVQDWLFLALCPPSLGAIALDSAGPLTAVLGWLLISLLNSGLYGLVGLFVDFVVSRLPKTQNAS
jgi:hypothetical protein